MRINIEDFFDKYSSEEYRHGIFIPEEVHDVLDTLYLQGEDYAVINDSVIDVIEEKKLDYYNRLAIIDEIGRHLNAGNKLEKVNILLSINEYKESIRIGEEIGAFMYYSYAYERLIILLHKIKDFESEKQYIQALLEYNLSDSRRQKYEERLTKLNKKLNEQTQGI